MLADELSLLRWPESWLLNSLCLHDWRPEGEAVGFDGAGEDVAAVALKAEEAPVPEQLETAPLRPSSSVNDPEDVIQLES